MTSRTIYSKSLSFLYFPGISTHTAVALAAPERAADIRLGVEVILRCRVEGTSDISFDWFR